MIYGFPNEQADTARVACRLAQAIEQKEPCSLISMADGESAVLWGAKGFGSFHYLSAWGFSAEDRLGVAEQLAAAIPKCDIVCLPRSGTQASQPGMGPRLREALYLWDIRPKPEALIGDSLISFYLLFDCWLWSLMENRKVLVVTSEAEKVVAALNGRQPPVGLATFAGGQWWRQAETTGIMLADGLAGSAQCLVDAGNLPWKPDLCLLGAGSRAAHLAVALAEMHSMPVIELGCVFSWFHTPSEPATIFKLYQEEG
ncbi:MAG TPA: hypothetical protein VNA25_30260 [Phycisphaerae bacterium]|nr:hypothetical protein [Phycisphaerae bacterium]